MKQDNKTIDDKCKEMYKANKYEESRLYYCRRLKQDCDYQMLYGTSRPYYCVKELKENGRNNKTRNIND